MLKAGQTRRGFGARAVIQPALGGDFNIADIFAVSGRTGYAVHMMRGGAYTNSDLTGPVTADGDPIGSVQDFSELGHKGFRDTSGNKPVYKTDGTFQWMQAGLIGGVRRSLDFDMETPDMGNQWTFAIFRVRAGGNNRAFAFSYGRNGAQYRFISHDESGLLLYSGAASFTADWPPVGGVGSIIRVDDTTTGCVVHTKAGVDFTGMSTASNATTSTGTANFNEIGSWLSASFDDTSIDIMAEVSVWTGVGHLDAGEVANIAAWMAAPCEGWA